MERFLDIAFLNVFGQEKEETYYRNGVDIRLVAGERLLAHSIPKKRDLKLVDFFLFSYRNFLISFHRFFKNTFPCSFYQIALSELHEIFRIKSLSASLLHTLFLFLAFRHGMQREEKDKERRVRQRDREDLSPKYSVVLT